MNRREFLCYIAGIIVVGCEGGSVYDYTPPPVPPPEPEPMKVEIVAEIEYQSFMSLVHLENGDILAGTYCFPEDCTKEDGWEWEDIGPKYSRFMQATVTEAQKFIYLVGTNNYRDEHNHDAATLWSYEVATGILTQLWCFEGFDYSSCIKTTEDGRIFLGLTKGWRSQSPGASLIEWDGQKPQPIAEFDEAEIRELVFKDEKIYCATRLDKVRGRVYEISGVMG